MDALAGVPNPFRQTIVTDPWHPAAIDVPAIHASAFESCRRALEWVRAEGRSTSVLMYGEAGSGKTHLLGRLHAHWAAPDPSRDGPQVVFVAVRLQTGPRRIWRHIRRSFAEDLLRPGADGSTQLAQILLQRFAEVRPAGGDLSLWWEWLRQEYPDPDDLERVIDGLFDRLDQDAQLGRDLCTVLGHLILERHRRDARAWLLGDHLPESALKALNVTAPADDDDEQEEQAHRTVIALCQLAGPRIPVVLCFDQVEALQVHPQDDAGLFAFGQAVMALYQQTSNALLISCIQSSFLERLRSTVRGAAWDRVAIHQSQLEPLRWEDAVRLITTRMDAQPELARLRADHREPLWPLDEARLKAEVGPAGTTARRILSTAAELFEAAAEQTPVQPVPVAQYLETAWQQHLDQALRAGAVEQADQVLSHGLPLLAHCLGREWVQSRDDPMRDLDLVLSGAKGRIGISLCNQTNLASLAARLKRLSEPLDRGKLEKLVLIRDARLPISPGAKKTLQYLDEFQKRGARLLRPSAEAMAALEALRSLLSDAKAGDLAHNGVPVPPNTVQDWLTAHLPRDLRELLDEIVTPPTLDDPPDPDDRILDALLELLGQRHVLPLHEAAAHLGRPAALLEGCARRHADQIGILSRPQMVLFQLTPDDARDGGWGLGAGE